MTRFLNRLVSASDDDAYYNSLDEYIEIHNVSQLVCVYRYGTLSRGICFT